MSNRGPKPPCPPPRGGGAWAGNQAAHTTRKLSIAAIFMRPFLLNDLKSRQLPTLVHHAETRPRPVRRRRVSHLSPRHRRRRPCGRVRLDATRYEPRARTHLSPKAERRGPRQSRRWL